MRPSGHREAGVNPAQCRCCVSEASPIMSLGPLSREGGRVRLTLEPEYLPAHNAHENLRAHGRVHGWPDCGLFAVPFWVWLFILPAAFQ